MKKLILELNSRSGGGGQVVSVLTFYSYDSSSNLAEVCNFSVNSSVIDHFKTTPEIPWVRSSVTTNILLSETQLTAGLQAEEIKRR